MMNISTVSTDASLLDNPATPILVLFHMTGCHHCDVLMPSFDAAAAELLESIPDLVVLKLESRQLTEQLAELYDVEGFPSVRTVFPGGWISKPLKQPQTKEDVVEFVEKSYTNYPRH